MTTLFSSSFLKPPPGELYKPDRERAKSGVRGDDPSPDADGRIRPVETLRVMKSEGVAAVVDAMAMATSHIAAGVVG